VDVPTAMTLLLVDSEIRLRRHWAAPMVPILWFSVVVGVARLRRPIHRRLAVAALILASTSTYLVDGLLPGGRRFDPNDLTWTSRAEQLSYLASRVPVGATVAASRRVLAHVANRADLYVFPPSYRGALWPPERRPQVYLVDLTNDGSLDMLEGRQSPLRTPRALYAIWLAGTDALMLIEHPPVAERRASGGTGAIRLDGIDDLSRGGTVELVLHWSAARRLTGTLTRVVRLLDADGSLIAERRGMALDAFFPSNEWPDGQIVLDRVRFDRDVAPGGRVVAGWLDERGREDLADILLSDSPQAPGWSARAAP